MYLETLCFIYFFFKENNYLKHEVNHWGNSEFISKPSDLFIIWENMLKLKHRECFNHKQVTGLTEWLKFAGERGGEITHWFILASHSANLLITSVGLQESWEIYDVQTICCASSVMSQAGKKRNPVHLMSSKYGNCLMSFGLVQTM